MKIFGLGIPELLIILVVILLIFGPKNLPKLGNAIGRAVKNLREGMGSNKAKEASETTEGNEAMEEVVVDSSEEEQPVAAKTVRRVVKKAS